MHRSGQAVLIAAAVAAACTPALDWREVRPAGAGITMLFPCKPDSHARQVKLGPDSIRLEMHACKASGVTWALAFAELGDPSRVGPALTELRTAAAGNLAASDEQVLDLKIEGATPNAASRHVQLQGRMPDGRVVVEQLAVFTKGTRVYQAVALGDTLDAEAARTFFGSVRLGS